MDAAKQEQLAQVVQTIFWTAPYCLLDCPILLSGLKLVFYTMGILLSIIFL